MSSTEEEKTPSTGSAAPSGEPRVPHLVVLTGPDVGTVYRLSNAGSIIGRDKAADIHLSQESVSGRHARLIVEGEQIFIEDLDSTNGTFVGIDRVKGRVNVPDGANIGLGIFTLLRLTYSPAIGEALSRAGGQGSRTAAKVSTRNYLLDVLYAEHAYARRHGTPLTLVFLRADAVSSVRPGAGEVIRDEAMGFLATEIDAAIRTEDFLARVDPEEFAVLTRTDGDAAERLAERVRARIESRSTIAGSALAFHTITAVVVPVRAMAVEWAWRIGHRPISPEDILSTSRALAGPSMHERTNAVVRLQTLAI